jgi:hypothetical protein
MCTITTSCVAYSIFKYDLKQNNNAGTFNHCRDLPGGKYGRNGRCFAQVLPKRPTGRSFSSRVVSLDFVVGFLQFLRW